MAPTAAPAKMGAAVLDCRAFCWSVIGRGSVQFDISVTMTRKMLMSKRRIPLVNDTS